MKRYLKLVSGFEHFVTHNTHHKAEYVFFLFNRPTLNVFVR